MTNEHDEQMWTLEQLQTDLGEVADEYEHATGIDRREFMLLSLVAAAASTLNVPRAARAQPALSPQPAEQPLVPMGESNSWTFQVHPGGTGAAIDELMRTRGAAAFRRATFVVAPWQGVLPKKDDEIAFLPAHRLSALIRARKITSARLTAIYLERMKRLDPTLLCAVTIMEDHAKAEAARADAELAAGKYRGPLHGLPYGVKDLFSTKGVRTTWGSEIFENRIIDEDAEVVVRLRDAGAVLIAKLSTGRFANNDTWYRGRTNNPWDVRRGSSGSSAGPSSATAAGCVAFAIGTETSGSIVSPARECGLSALRPTFGRVSRHGGMVLAWSRDRVGPICRTIEDCAMVFNTIHGVDPKDTSTITAPFHFNRAITLASLRIGVDAGAPAGFVDALRALGAKPTPIGPRPQAPGGGGGFGGESTAFFDYFVRTKAKELGIDIATIEAAAARTGRGGGGGGRGGAGGAAPTDTAGRGGGAPPVPPEIARIVSLPGTNARGALALDFIQSQRRRHAHLVDVATFLKDYDLYVPSANGWDVGLHSTTGHPCAVVPWKFEPRVGMAPGGGGRGAPPAPSDTAGGRGGRGGGRGGDTTTIPAAFNTMPTCAVIAGNLFNDDIILSVAHRFQMSTDIHTHHPSL